jgi:hypothetical protein
VTITLELPPEVEAQIAIEAAQKGMSLADYLVAVIQGRNLKMSEGVKTYLLSESALAKDWLRREEDKAWQHL